MKAIAGAEAAPSHESRILIDADMVHAFALVTGDDNPLHLDSVFAAATRFGKPIAHGALLVGLISRVMGAEFPGPGTVYLSQQIAFLRPVPVSSWVRVQVSIAGVDEARSVTTLSTDVRLDDGTLCATGTAQVRFPRPGAPKSRG